MNRNRLVRWSLFAVLLLSFSTEAFSQVFISVRIGPPALPVYAQPICPGPGYVWTPGYWSWSDDDGYYWVPGTWVVAPVGLLWTPGYWGWNDGFYLWHAGYWGPHVGFYGGIDYGYGYNGEGFYGGEWRGRQFYYNRSVTNVNVVNVTNVYNKTVIVNNRTRVSYNGGNGGVNARATRQQEQAARERHTEVLAAQREHQQAASRNRELFARVNQGRPQIAATVKPADFDKRAVVPAKAAGGTYHAPKMTPKEARGPATAENRAPERPNGNRANAPANRPGTPGSKEQPRNEGRNNEQPRATTDHPAQPSPRTAEPKPKENTKSNDNFHPFTPPAKGLAKSPARSEAPNANRPNNNRPEARPENRPAPKPAQPPKASRPENTPRANPPHANNEARPTTPRPAPPARQAEPKAAPRPERSVAPKSAAPKPSAPPREKPNKEPK